MSWDDFIDTEIVSNPAYWLLAGGAEFALLIGFKLQSAWGTDMGMPLLMKVLVLALIPIAAYFVVMFTSRR